MPFQKINGIDLYYERHGDSGDPLVLVHGWTGDITDWRHQIAEFSPTHRVLVLDNRGHGRSEAPSDRSIYTVDRMVEDTEALIAHAGFDRYHLVGHSMGGAVAQEIALRSPQRLLSLTLHNTTYSFALLSALESHPNIRAWTEYRHRLAETQGMAAVARLVNPFPPPPNQDPARQAEKNERFAAMSADVFLGAWDGLVGWPGTADRAAAIRTPTLVLYSDLDAPLIQEGSRKLAQLIANASVAVIPQTAHQPQEDRPELYNAALRPFLEAHASAPVEQAAS
ncbi:MAG: alpha/beta hydrolase [Dehalococcoidia bacterium]